MKSKVKSKKSKSLIIQHLSSVALFVLFTVHCSLFTIQAQSTEFTYQGRLLDSSLPPTANYDFQFSLWNALVADTQQGSTQTVPGVLVTNGIFTVKLDFGAQFTGAARFLEIAVRPAGGGAYTTLAPRQSITSAPYSVRSLNSTTADTATSATTANNALNLGGVPAADYVVTTDPRMTDARTPTAGSANYIQNQNAGAQSSSNFNISGTGTANIFSAATQYNIGGSRILSNAGVNNLFAGVGAGFANTGGSNSFFGAGSGNSNQTGNLNSFFGASSGVGNQTGGGNSFFGANSGVVNQTGGDNAFFGTQSGGANQNGSENSFFGSRSGNSNQTGFGNSFFGIRSGQANTTGSFNTTIGSNANVGAGNLDFATAIGALSVVSSSNTIVLGRSTGADKVVIPGLGGSGDTALCRNAGNQVATCSSLSVPEGSSNYIQNQNTGPQSSSNFNISGTGTANIFNAATQYDIAGLRILSNAGSFNLFAGVGAGAVNTGGDNAFFGGAVGARNTTGFGNAFFGASAGFLNETGNFNAFVGFGAGVSNTTGTNNTIIGGNANVGADNLINATAIGAGAVVTASSQVQLGRIGEDTVRIGTLAAATATQLCIDANNVLAACSSSARYKENIRPFGLGLGLVKRLQPMRYNWIKSKEADLGLIAEEVAAVEPLLVTRNDKGEIQGVKYDQLNVVLINAVNEQQAQIEAQQKEIAEQKTVNQKLQTELDALKKLVCGQNPTAEICKP